MLTMKRWAQLLASCAVVSEVATAAVSSHSGVHGDYGISDYVGDRSLNEAALNNLDPSMRNLQASDSCSEAYYEDIFKETNVLYDRDTYTRFEGLDATALLGSGVALSDNYAVIGSTGFDIYSGVVHVYELVSASEWQLQQLVQSPTHANANFGQAVAIDPINERVVISANAYNLYEGIVYVYDFVLGAYWENSAFIRSPLAGKLATQGFGYRVDISGDFIIASTSGNNAYIFQLVGRRWKLVKNLEPPADDARFGRSVAIHNDFAVVGAYGVDESAGAAFVYKRNATTDSWDLLQVLQSVRGYGSFFGWAVDLHADSDSDSSTRIIAGAPGLRADLYDPRGERVGNNTGYAYIFSYDEAAGVFNGDNFTELIAPNGPDSSFGVDVALSADAAMVGADGFPCGAVTGSAFLYSLIKDSSSSGRRQLQASTDDSNWQLNASYPSPAGSAGHFGHMVAVSAAFTAIGAYGFENLQGALYLAMRNPTDFTASPSFQPSSRPSPAPSQPNEGAALNIGTDNTLNTDNELELGLLIALFLAVLLAAGAAGTCLWCCCCIAAPIAGKKKKKKKEEKENSPYTVHSYRGYSEADEYAYSDTSETITDSQYTAPLPMPPMPMPMKKDGGKNVKFMDDAEMRRMFPYKVYGPRGYADTSGDMTEEELLRMKAEMFGSKAAGGSTESSQLQQQQSPYAEKLAMMQQQQPSQYASYMPPAAGQDMHNKRRGPYSFTSQYPPQQPPSYHSNNSSYSSYNNNIRTNITRSGSMYSQDSDSQGSYSTYVMDDDTVFTEGDRSAYRSRDGDRNYERDDDDASESVGSYSQSFYSGGSQSLVEQARLRGVHLKQTGQLPTTAAAKAAADSSSASDQSRLVNEARAKYRAYKQSTAATGAESHSESTEASYSQENSRQLYSSNSGSYYDTRDSTTTGDLRNHNSNGGFNPSFSQSQSQSQIITADSQRDNDDQSVRSYGSAGSKSSLVSSAKARYAELQRATAKASSSSYSNGSSGSELSAEYGNHNRTAAAAGDGDESVGSSGSRSLVDAARDRYAKIQQQMESSASQSSDASSKESLVNKAKARYEAYRSQKATVTTTQSDGAPAEDFSSNSSDSRDVAATVAAAVAQTPEQRAISAREAAMSKFAVFKAKAEEEARRRAADEARMRDALTAERAAAAAEELLRAEEDARIEKAISEAEARADAATYDQDEA